LGGINHATELRKTLSQVTEIRKKQSTSTTQERFRVPQFSLPSNLRSNCLSFWYQHPVPKACLIDVRIKKKASLEVKNQTK